MIYMKYEKCRAVITCQIKSKRNSRFHYGYCDKIALLACFAACLALTRPIFA